MNKLAALKKAGTIHFTKIKHTLVLFLSVCEPKLSSLRRGTLAGLVADIGANF